MKSLVVYFSRKGENYAVGYIEEGNACHIAKEIAKYVNGDLFEIEPLKEYSLDYKKCTEEALEELNSNRRPLIKNQLKSIDLYDVIFLCYPNWWGTYPRPLSTFLDSFDFSGKIIMPMCTHEGSKMGNSVKELESVLKGAIIKKGLPIQGIYAKESSNVIKKWIEGELNVKLS